MTAPPAYGIDEKGHSAAVEEDAHAAAARGHQATDR